MKTIAIIPARSGSKGLPNKNIKLFCGKPLLAWTIEAALESKQFDEVMVSTDSVEYAEIAREYGANVPFLRSELTASDIAGTWDVAREVIEKYLNSFVKDSIYLSDFKIYYYNVKDSSKLEKRYKRYDTTININKDIVEIDSSKAKNNYFMDKLYVISDIIEIIIEVIGDVLMN